MNKIWNFSKSINSEREASKLCRQLKLNTKDLDISQGLSTKQLAAIAQQKQIYYVDEFLHLQEPSNISSTTAKTPVISFLGHVDHGKTSLLEAVSKFDLLTKEYGGITQDIKAFSCTYKNCSLTFLDTPGHKSFSAMRSLVGEITDLVVLVIAADSGVCEQTIESIGYINKLHKPCVVAITKTDVLPDDKAESQIKQIICDLAQHELLVESQGGDALVVPVCYKDSDTVAKFMDAVMLQCEVQHPCYATKAIARGFILESASTKAGLQIKALLCQGVMRIKDKIFQLENSGNIRILRDHTGADIKEAIPGKPFFIVGLKTISKDSHQIYSIPAKEKHDVQRVSKTSQYSKSVLDLLNVDNSHKKTLNLVLKAPDYNALDALQKEVSSVVLPSSCEHVFLNVIRSTIGSVSEREIDFIKDNDALVVSFQVFSNLQKLGISLVVENNIYSLKKLLHEYIVKHYALTQDIETNKAKIVDVFYIAKEDKYIAGCYVESGIFKIDEYVTVIRDKKTILTRAKIQSIKLKKTQLDQAKSGQHYGFLISSLTPKKGDQILS